MEKQVSFTEKVIAVQSALKAPKSQYNSFGKYKYRNCEDILEAVKPLLQEQGLFLTICDDIQLVGSRFYVKATATITDGQGSLSNSAFAREAEKKSGMDESQITGAASSYARKYALNGLFAIDDTKDADYLNQGETKGKKTEEPKASAIAKIYAAQSIGELTMLFNDFTSLHNDTDFMSACTQRKNQIKQSTPNA